MKFGLGFFNNSTFHMACTQRGLRDYFESRLDNVIMYRPYAYTANSIISSPPPLLIIPLSDSLLYTVYVFYVSGVGEISTPKIYILYLIFDVATNK